MPEVISLQIFAMRLALAIAVGGLIGLEREHRKKPIAGVRAYAFSSVMGMLSIYASELLESKEVAYVALIAYSFLIGITYFLQRRPEITLVKETTEVLEHRLPFHVPLSLFVTYVLGVLVGFGKYNEAIIIAIIIAILNATSRTYERLVKHLTEAEIFGALEFAAIGLVLYPLAPDKPIDPYGVINLRHIILVVLLISSIGFVSFVVMKKIGPEKGLEISGFLGGVVNAHAAGAAVAIRYLKDTRLLLSASFAILLANIAMFLRNTALAAFLEINVAKYMLIPQAGMIIILGYMILRSRKAIRLFKRYQADIQPIKLESPFTVKPAVSFALIFTLIYASGDFAQKYIGSFGVYATAIGGLVSSGAVTASMATLAMGQSIEPTTAAITAILANIVAIISNPLFYGFRARELAINVLKPLLIVCTTGFIVLVSWIFLS